MPAANYNSLDIYLVEMKRKGNTESQRMQSILKPPKSFEFLRNVKIEWQTMFHIFKHVSQKMKKEYMCVRQAVAKKKNSDLKNI